MSLGGQSWEDYSFVIIVKTLGIYQAEKFGICCCTVCFFIDFTRGTNSPTEINGMLFLLISNLCCVISLK